MKFSFNVEEVKYVKLLCMKDGENPVCIKAALQSIDDNDVVVRIERNENIDLEYSQEITMSIICKDGLYRTKTKMKSFKIAPESISLYLEVPTQLEYQQNREYFRVAAEYDCVYYAKTNEGPVNITAKTIDLSGNGICILLPVLAISEEDADLDIMLEEKLIRVKVKYIRSAKIEEGYKVAFTFTRISLSDQDYISKLCIKKQLEMRRNNQEY